SFAGLFVRLDVPKWHQKCRVGDTVRDTVLPPRRPPIRTRRLGSRLATLNRLTPCSTLLATMITRAKHGRFRQAKRPQRHPRLRLLLVVLSACPARALAACAICI